MGQCQEDSTTAGIVLLRATSEEATAYNEVAAFRNSGGNPTVAPSADTKETTDSSDKWKTYRKTLKDGGSIAPTLAFKPDDPGHLLMKGDWDDKECPWPYMIVNLNSGRGIKFEGLLVTSWGQEFNLADNEVNRIVGLKTSGAVTETNTLPNIEVIGA